MRPDTTERDRMIMMRKQINGADETDKYTGVQYKGSQDLKMYVDGCPSWRWRHDVWNFDIGSGHVRGSPNGGVYFFAEIKTESLLDCVSASASRTSASFIRFSIFFNFFCMCQFLVRIAMVESQTINPPVTTPAPNAPRTASHTGRLNPVSKGHR